MSVPEPQLQQTNPPKPEGPQSPYEIETASGGYVDLFVPLASSIRLEDVAHGLSMTCRFAGQTRRFYSVAQHAVMVSRKLEDEGYPELAMAGLHHDDAEAFLGDLTRPLKAVLGRLFPDDADMSFADLEGDMDRAIFRALAMGTGKDGNDLWSPAQFEAQALKDADEWALLIEAHALLPSGGLTWGQEARWPLKRPEWAASMHGHWPEASRAVWLARHYELLAL